MGAAVTHPRPNSGPRVPPVQCGNCGAEIKFQTGQLVGDPEAVEQVREMQAALEDIAHGLSGRGDLARRRARQALGMEDA